MELRAGYKKTEVGVIPKDWEVKTFKDICWVNQGLQIAIERRKKTPTPKSKTYITIQYLNEGKDTEYIDEYSSSVCCDKDDILMTRTGNTGIVVSGVEGVFHNNFFKINFNGKLIDKDFLLFYLKQNKTQKIILTKAGASTIPDLNHNDFYSISTPLPPLPEQRAIAAALSDVDALLAKLDQLVAKKRDIKKAATQQLLTGKKRLPGFSGEWEEHEIGDLCYIEIGESTEGGNANYLEIGDINIDSKTYCISEKEKLSVPGSVKVPRGTLLISTVRPTRGAITITEETLYVSSAFCRLHIECMFIFYIVSQDKFLKYLGDNSRGGTYPTCKKEDILGYKCFVPKLPEEQTAIAAVLSDMDAEIAALEAHRDKTRDLKQGMMQELLTGKIRLV